MAGITATADPTAGKVSLDIQMSQTTITKVSVGRVGPDGFTQLIRHGDQIASPGGHVVMDDFEAPLDVPVYYVATQALPVVNTAPQSMFPSTPGNNGGDASGPTGRTEGVWFTAKTDGTITALKFYRNTILTSTSRNLHLWDVATQAKLVQVASTGESGTGWRTLALPSPYPVKAGVQYKAAWSDTDFFTYQAVGPNEAPLLTPVQGISSHYGIDMYPDYDQAMALYPGADVIFVPAPEKQISNTVTLASGGGSWMKDPGYPSQNFKIEIITSIETLNRTARSGVFPILDRVNPIVVTAKRQGPTGTLVMHTLTDSERIRFTDLIARGTILLLQTPDAYGFGSAYIWVGDVEEARLSVAQAPERRWTLPFIVVDRPEGLDSQTTIANTWADVKAKYATWADLAATGMTWAQLLEEGV